MLPPPPPPPPPPFPPRKKKKRKEKKMDKDLPAKACGFSVVMVGKTLIANYDVSQ